MCLAQNAGVDGGSGPTQCIPMCATDSDCGGYVCNVKTNLCTATHPSGLAMGSDCDPTAMPDPCQGFCIGNSSTDAHSGFCTALCNGGQSGTPTAFGLPGACGSNPQQGSPQDAACLFGATSTNGTPLSICAQLCDCDTDCHGSGVVCQSWASAGVSQPSQFEVAFQRKGYCTSSKDSEGGTVAGIPTCSKDGGVN